MEVNVMEMEEMIVANLTGISEGVDIAVSKDDFVGGDADTKLFGFWGTCATFFNCKSVSHQGINYEKR